MAKRISDMIIHLDYEDEYKDGKVEVNIITSEPEELIRCKDCKHWNITSDGFGECNIMARQFLGEEYCSFGERNNDDKTTKR